MHMKALIFDDGESADNILKATSPSQVKELGREVQGFTDGLWDLYKERMVLDATYFKFTKCTSKSENRTLKERLLATGDRELIEANSWDRVWGIGHSTKDAEANRDDWSENLLREKH